MKWARPATAWLAPWREALRNLRAAKLRSFLAIVGIVVGSAAVVALMTCSQLAGLHAAAQFNTLGTELLAVDLLYPTSATGEASVGSGLTLEMTDQLASQISGIGVVAPYIFLYQSSRYHQQEFSGPVLGVTETFMPAAKLSLDKGRFITRYEQAHPVCVIGADLAQQLKSKGVPDPVGEQLLLGGQYFTVVGVLNKAAPNLFVYLELNQAILIPLMTSEQVAKVAGISNLLIRLPSREQVATFRQDITYYLQQRLPKVDITVRDPQQLIQVMQQQQHTFALLLIAIAAISLIVGGIGVANIMLMIVLERRREIGVRLAVGALPCNILRLFFLEAVVLTLLGGLVGLLMGELIALGWSYYCEWEFSLLVSPMMIGGGLTLIIGCGAGFYPAWRASKLDPISALRME